MPPFGDAHCHHFDGTFDLDALTQTYFHDGIFYAMYPCNSRQSAERIKARVNLPTGIDVKFANGGLTGENSHPIPLLEGVGRGYYSYPVQIEHRAELLHDRRRENDAYFILNTKADLDQKWAQILAGKPGLIKVFLCHSEDNAQRGKRPGYGEGIAPELLPEVVKRAHRAGLRVAAHADSATDYRIALAAGVDLMAHLCGYTMEPEDPLESYRLTPDDAALTAKRHVGVIPTACLSGDLDAGANKIRARNNQIRNLKLLKEAGVRFGLGVDTYGVDSLQEALYLNGTGVWSNLEMLKMWCEDTPHMIFPERKIGSLQDGYEASLIVLNKNPLEDFRNVQTVRLRFKQGVLLTVPKEGTGK